MNEITRQQQQAIANTKETIQLPYDEAYNRGYNDAFMSAYQQALSKNQHRFIQVADDISDDGLWGKRENAIQSIFRSMIMLGIGLFILAFFIISLLQMIVMAGIDLYTLSAPLILAIIIGYFIRGKRNA